MGSELGSRLLRLVGAVVIVAGTSIGAAVADTPKIGTTFPPDFPVPTDASLHAPVLGFGGAKGPMTHTPVIFLHGNNDTPYPTTCNGSYGAVQAFAQYFADHGYAANELWALGYQGDQCDL